jgi:hypothetical protein
VGRKCFKRLKNAQYLDDVAFHGSSHVEVAVEHNAHNHFLYTMKLVCSVTFGIFACHSLIWLVVCLGLFAINMMTTLLFPPWFLFPTVGWGIGVAIHGVITHVIIISMGESTTSFFDQYISRYVPQAVVDFVKESMLAAQKCITKIAKTE